MPDVNQTITYNQLDSTLKTAIDNIRARNQKLSGKSVADLDLGNLPFCNASDGMDGIRSSHGQAQFTFNIADFHQFNGVTWVGRYPQTPSLATAHAKVKACWLDYARRYATDHAKGQIPALIEFSGKQGSRVLLHYMSDFVLYTPNHYTTYYLVTENDGTLLRTMT